MLAMSGSLLLMLVTSSYIHSLATHVDYIPLHSNLEMTKRLSPPSTHRIPSVLLQLVEARASWRPCKLPPPPHG